MINKTFKVNILVFIFCLSLFNGCSGRLSTEDLAEQVQISIEETYEKKELNVNITSFELTHKGGNEYVGVMNTSEEYGEFTYKVEVTYDGEAIMWEVK